MSQTVLIEGGLYIDEGHSVDGMLDPKNITFFRGGLTAFSSYVPVMPHTISIEMPSGLDLRSLIVAGLEKKRAALTAEFSRSVSEINAQIGKMLAITSEVVPQRDAVEVVLAGDEEDEGPF